MKKYFVGIFCAAAVSTQAAPAWPQFRGPNATGFSEDARPPAKFGPKENVAWQADLPGSPSSPIISGEHLFLTTFSDGKLQVRSYNTANGALRWTKEVRAPKLEEFHNAEGSPAASTPATDGERVVSYFGSAGLICHDFSGKVLWSYPLPPANTRGNFGSGTSPIIHEGKVILNRDVAENSFLLAVDLNTGKKNVGDAASWRADKLRFAGRLEERDRRCRRALHARIFSERRR